MGPLALAALVRARGVLRVREGWSREGLIAHQQSALADLRTYAYAHSPFYQRFHAGLQVAPLAELPVLTKATLMERFDELVTDRRLRLADLERQLEGASATDRYLGTYRVAATGGTSGRRGVFAASPAEWTMTLASYARAYAWAGLAVGLAHPLRMAIVSSTAPTHQSSMVGATVRNPLVPTLRLDATEPLWRSVAALNQFRPQAVVGYASVIGELAAEQIAGRLAIAPRAVFTASEVLTPEIRAAAAAAWAGEPFDVYAATETAGIASECRAHHLHAYEDLVITEAVDGAGRAVPPGIDGARLLVTVLFSRTQPLIRYELDDRVRFAPEPASDLGPFRTVVAQVRGRTEDVLILPGANGPPVRIHPNLFHAVLERTGRPWQVVAHPDGLEVLVTAPTSGLDASLRAALAGAGAYPAALRVRQVPDIPRTAVGKVPLVRAEQEPLGLTPPADST